MAERPRQRLRIGGQRAKLVRACSDRAVAFGGRVALDRKMAFAERLERACGQPQAAIRLGRHGARQVRSGIGDHGKRERIVFSHRCETMCLEKGERVARRTKSLWHACLEPFYVLDCTTRDRARPFHPAAP
jgi:hypothetical protein